MLSPCFVFLWREKRAAISPYFSFGALSQGPEFFELDSPKELLIEKIKGAKGRCA